MVDGRPRWAYTLPIINEELKMQDYLITFATKPHGTFSYLMTGYTSKAEAVRNATSIARVELGRDLGRMKEARLYNGKGYVCKG